MAKKAPKMAIAAPSEPSENVVFEYIKSPFFRVIHADGAVGGVTPSGNIHFALYSERGPIPKQTVHGRNPDGTLGDPIPSQTISRAGIIREMDVDVVMNRALVPVLITWLKKALEQAENQVKEYQNLQGHSDVE